MLPSPMVVSLTLFLSLPLLFFFSPQTLPLNLSPVHTATTTTASAAVTVAAATTAATRPKPKIAFLFLTNSNLSFAPLWEKFFKGNHKLFTIYVHADPSTAVAPPGGVFRRRFIPSQKTRRGSPTLISAARRLLSAAISDDPMNQYFALVSQHCIPLHSFRFIYHHLFNKKKKKNKKPRYPSFIEMLSDEPNLFDRYMARGLNVMLPEVPFEQFRVGSQFFILTRRHAAAVVKDRRLWKKFRLPCVTEEPCYPEEHYFPTLLNMVDPKGCTRFTLTRVNWTGSWDGHPHLYTAPEVSPELVFRLRESNSSYSYFFARKFSPECLTPLMAIADDVIFRG